MPNLTVSSNVDTMLAAADNAAIRTAIGLGTTNSPSFSSITTTDRVGIGTTAPGAKLTVITPFNNYPTDKNPVISLRQSTDNTFGFDWIQDGQNTGDLHLHRVNSGVSNHVLAITRGAGNLGIGTTSPTSKLHVAFPTSLTGLNLASDATTSVSNFVTWSTTWGGLSGGIKSGPDNGWTTQIFSNQQLSFSAGGVDSSDLLISAAGLVGIGTNAPTAKLHVVGDGLITGTVGIGDTGTSLKQFVIAGQAISNSLYLSAPQYIGLNAPIISLMNGGIRSAMWDRLAGITLTASSYYGFNSSETDAGVPADTTLRRGGSANFHLGAADAAAPVAQTLSVQSVVAGTTNTAGADFTIDGSQGTGTGSGGAIILRVAPGVVTSGSTINTLSPGLRIDGNIHPSGGIGIRGIGSNSVLLYHPGGGSVFFGYSNGTIWGGFPNASTVRIGDSYLINESTDVLALRNGAAAQTFRVYNTFLGTTANEWFEIDWKTSPGTVRLFTMHGGTGVARNIDISAGGTLYFGAGASSPIRMYSSGVERWNISAAGHFIAGADNTYDIGASGASRPRNIYVGNSLTTGSIAPSSGADLIFNGASTGAAWKITPSGHFHAFADNAYDIGASGASRPRNLFLSGYAVVGSSLGVGGDLTVGDTKLLGWISGRSIMSSPADGYIRFTDSFQTNFNRLQFGGTSASFPALKRVGTDLQVVVANTTAAIGVAAADADLTFIEDRYRRKGAGDPNGTVTAPIGAVYHNTTGGATTSFYVKESGTGNTGWVGK